MSNKNGTNGERNIKIYCSYFYFLYVVSVWMKIKQLFYIF